MTLKSRLAGEGATVKSIATSPIRGLLEVVLENNTVMYATPDGSYFVVGDIIDLLTKRAVTRERQKQVGRAAFQNLPHHLALKSGTIGAKESMRALANQRAIGDWQLTAHGPASLMTLEMTGASRLPLPRSGFPSA